MSRVFVARSAKLSKWGADVGVGNHLYKVGCADQSPDSLIKDGWAGETDWKLLASEEAEGAGEDEVIASIARREKMIDPALYPKIKGATGIFKLKPSSVENHILIARALDGAAQLEVKLKPKDFADYLLHCARR